MLCIFLTLLSIACLFAQEETGGPSHPTYQIQAFSTLYEIRVVDGKGNLVTGLSEDHFVILESGKRRPIQFFEPMVATPVSLGILLDTGSSSSEEQILTAKEAVFELIHALEPTDEVVIAVYDVDIHFLSELTTDRIELLRALENVSPGGRFSFFSKLAHVFASSGHTGRAVDRTLMKLKQCEHRNKVVLIFSAALGSIGPATQEHAEIAGAKLFAVTWKNRVGDALNFWGDKTASKRAIRGSGGIAFPGQEILERIYQLRESVKSFYLVAYEPLSPDTQDKEPELEIRIRNQPDLHVYAMPRVTRESPVY
jgi:hypothetical protein